MPKMPIRNASSLRKIGTRFNRSEVEPLFDRMMTTSPGEQTPRSPCAASAAWRKTLGVPVLDSVAASLRPM